MEQLLGMQVRVQFTNVPLFGLYPTKNQILGVDDRNNWNELQGNFCSVIIVRPRNMFVSVL